MAEIGVDIGGTFTDVVLLREDGTLHSAKVPTTPKDPIEGVRSGVERVLEVSGCRPGDVSRFVHGTTVAVNALLERKGAITGVLMTKGFEDTLEIGRQKRSRLYELYLEPETPTFLAPRRRRAGITERVGADGSILTPLDEDEVRAAIHSLTERQGVTALSVCYLFSFRNPAHERRTREIVEAEFPGLDVSLSSEVDPTFREYERLVVTTLDAYLRGVVGSYVERLAKALASMGFEAELQVMQSRGGITSTSAIARRPVSLLLSGLAAGVVGSRFAASAAGVGDIITLDTGGTSCDIALVQSGKPLVANTTRIGRLPLRQQMIDVNTIGAGGGSVAWLDDVGGLRVGPHSMGSEPGPACYGRGGAEATVTDASLVLGYLNPERFAGGRFTLDRRAAETAIDRLADRLGLDRTATAAGIHRIVNARMADEIRRVSVQRGYDPRAFSLLALGGAGPVHAGALACELAMDRVIVPEVPGVLSAFGLLVADVEHDRAETYAVRADGIELEDYLRVRRRLDARCDEMMRRDGVPPDAVERLGYADMRYVGQSYELEVDLRDETSDPIAAAVAAFHQLHSKLYGHADETAPVEFVNLRAVHAYRRPPPGIDRRPQAASTDGAPHATRPAYFAEAGGFVDTPTYDRDRLETGRSIAGPAIVEQSDTTILILPGQVAYADAGGSIIVENPKDAG